MATGYTHGVVDGKVTDFATFCLQCAREFDACIMQRDDSIDAPPELPKRESYHDEWVDKAQSELAELNALTPEQWRERFDSVVLAAKKANQDSEAKAAEQLARLEAMRNSAEAWVPPTEDHRILKKFMLEQLDETIDFDGKAYTYNVPTDFESWKFSLIEQAQKSVERYKKHAEEDRERHQQRCDWITKLYQSLGREVKAAA